jgi:hypothetical protein
MALILAEVTHLIEWNDIFGSIDKIPRLACAVIQSDVVGCEEAQCRYSRCGDDHIINAIDIATYPSAKDGRAQSVSYTQAVGEVQSVLEANPALVRFCHSRVSTTTPISERKARGRRSAYIGEDKDGMYHLFETERHVNISDIPFLATPHHAARRGLLGTTLLRSCDRGAP